MDVYYGDFRAVSGVIGLAFGHNEIVALIGSRSGCGKSTLPRSRTG